MKFKYEKYNVVAIIALTHLTKPYLNRNTKKINESGITVISLIITIVVMFILASVTINIGFGEIEESRRVGFVTYMQTIQTKVDFISEYEEYSNYGEELSDKNKQLLQNVLNSENETFLTESEIYKRGENYGISKVYSRRLV